MGPKDALGEMHYGTVDPADPDMSVPKNCATDCPYRVQDYGGGCSRPVGETLEGV